MGVTGGKIKLEAVFLFGGDENGISSGGMKGKTDKTGKMYHQLTPGTLLNEKMQRSAVAQSEDSSSS